MEHKGKQEEDFAYLWKKDPAYEAGELLKLGENTERFGLQMTKERAEYLVAVRNESLKKHRRVEFGKGILEELIREFEDSRYLNDDNWAEVMGRLQDIFYFFKNETADRMSDQELLHCMKEQFETVCYGDTDYLENTCLERIARMVRGGDTSFEAQDGMGVYGAVDEEQRWDVDLYCLALKNME